MTSIIIKTEHVYPKGHTLEGKPIYVTMTKKEYKLHKLIELIKNIR